MKKPRESPKTFGSMMSKPGSSHFMTFMILTTNEHQWEQAGCLLVTMITGPAGNRHGYGFMHPPFSH
jgi:hypothetical protein